MHSFLPSTISFTITKYVIQLCMSCNMQPLQQSLCLGKFLGPWLWLQSGLLVSLPILLEKKKTTSCDWLRHELESGPDLRSSSESKVQVAVSQSTNRHQLSWITWDGLLCLCCTVHNKKIYSSGLPLPGAVLKVNTGIISYFFARQPELIFLAASLSH